MFLPSGGKGRTASLDIYQQVQWVGAIHAANPSASEKQKRNSRITVS